MIRLLELMITVFTVKLRVHRPWLLMLLIGLTNNGFAQTIKNIRTVSDNQKVIVEYDVEGIKGQIIDVFVSVKVNDEKIIQPKQLTGDLRNLQNGKDKRIEWLAYNEIGAVESDIQVNLHLVLRVDYEVKLIGSQYWMTRNLDVQTFRNGDSIMQARTANEWSKAAKEGIPAWCYYNNKRWHGRKYGKLYNWHAVNDPRGLAPAGFHIPTLIEWEQLSSFTNRNWSSTFKHTRGWKIGHKGTNESGFSALPGGRRYSFGAFGSGSLSAFWWSSNKSEMGFAKAWVIPGYSTLSVFSNENVGDGLSVRCVRD